MADLIQLELLRKENLATQLKIAETELKLAQLNASSRSPEATGTTPSISPVTLQSAIEPNVSSSPCLPSQLEFPSLNQLRSRKKAGSTLPNQFLLSVKGTVDYDKLDMVGFVSGYLEFCKVQPESLKASLLNHLQLLMDRAITYSWPSVRNFHLSVHNAVEQGRLTWSSAETIRERSQTFFTHLDLRSNSAASHSFNTTSHYFNKAKDHLCKEWNYSGKCSCLIADVSYKTIHKCRVCNSSDHAMLMCPKRKYPIPNVPSSSAASSKSDPAS